ncbi:Hypothetical protein D9617_10g072960 [Elsinoe fawcettii]|nr:Hypothetical protein D9617_10g072960 [Elsinoe fawcettii]
MTAPSEDAEVILNRANVSLARSQKVVESWLGPAFGLQSEASLWDENEDDEEAFKAEPDTLGVGAKAPDDDVGFGLKRRQPTTDDKLLEQIMGKKAAKEHRAKMAAQKASQSQAAVQASGGGKGVKLPVADVDSEEEQGRASAFRSKGSRKRMRTEESPIDAGNADESSIEAKASQRSGGGKASKEKSSKPLSYLDQILAEKSRKKREKSK